MHKFPINRKEMNDYETAGNALDRFGEILGISHIELRLFDNGNGDIVPQFHVHCDTETDARSFPEILSKLIAENLNDEGLVRAAKMPILVFSPAERPSYTVNFPRCLYHGLPLPSYA